MHARIRKKLGFALVATLVSAIYGYPHAGLAPKRNVRSKPQPVVYLALGDSTGVGIGAKHGGYVQRLFARIERARPGSQLINRCASAAATADILHKQMGHLANARATLVTVGIGANDLIRGVTVEQFARNYEEIVVRLKEKTGAPILLMNIPDMSLAPAVPAYIRDSARRHIQAFNERIEDVAKRHELLVVDLYGPSREFSSRQEFFSPDGIHPSDAGYEFWAGLVWSAMEKVIKE